MAYAYIDENNRVLAFCHEQAGEDWVKFDNPETIDENCKNGLEDFVIEGGRAHYRPTKAKQVTELKANLANTDYITAKALESILGASDLVSLFAALRNIGEEYAETLAKRKKWRERVRELEGEE